VVTGHSVLIEVGDGSTPTITVDPVFASNMVDNSFASASLITGTFAASTFTTPGDSSELARSSGFIGFRNDGAHPITFMPGDITGHVTATFAHTIGSPPPPPVVPGFAKELLASLFVGPTFSSAGVLYHHSSDGTFLAQPADVSLGAMTIINTATQSSLDVEFLMDGFTVGPGEIFNLQIANLSAFAFAVGPGWGASVDASNTFQLSMDLPDGVTLDSPFPLAWVTTAIPEPETYALMLGGLGFVTWIARRRRKSA